jgi:hypothetical protein
MISESDIQTWMKEDGVKIALVMELIFRLESYQTDIPTIPEDEAFSVLNLTHSVSGGFTRSFSVQLQIQILDRGLPENDVIDDEKVFKRRAHRLLNILADFLGILPEELAVHGVVLLSDRPIKYGGFADIYHGQYVDSSGKDVEVALKVLKIFQDQSDEGRRLILQKFAKEALVWHYLKHPNVVPFLGVDATTFPSPTMAMVSTWMAQGSALNYMAENSPVLDYAIFLVCKAVVSRMFSS